MGCPSEVILEDNLVFSITTHDPDTGVLTDADAVPAYRVYEDETGTAILTGNMAKLDDANTTGFYSELIACTTANGFENGKSYNIYITATVDSDEGGISFGFKARDLATTAAAVWDRVLSGATHNIATSAGRRLRNIQDFGIYDMASVWVDEVAGTSSGTIDGEDATVTNRADDFDNAKTVADSVGLDQLHIQSGNTITLSATVNNCRIWGAIWTLILGGQDIGGSLFENATVSGIGTGTSPRFMDCLIGTVTLPPGRFVLCSLTDTLTVGSAGNFQFVSCQSGVAGSGAPIVDLGGAVGATTMEFRRWSGGLTLNNVQAGDVISVDVVSGGTITVNGAGGAVVIRGHCNVVDGSGASVSITQTSVVNMTKINTEADTALGDYGANTVVPDAAGTTGGLIAALNNLSSAEAQTAATASLVAIHLDHLLAADYDPASQPGVATALLNELIESNAGVSRYTTGALAQAPGGSGGDATAANQTTLLNRIGAITGSGDNTVLGLFIALLNKAGATPSDVGGTFDPITDSVEALREKVDTIVAGAATDLAIAGTEITIT